VVSGLDNPFLPWFALTDVAIALVSALLTVGAAATFRARPMRGIPFAAQVLLCGAATGIVSGVVSAPVVAYRVGGVTGSGSALVVAVFLKAGENLMSAAMFSGLAADPPDKILQVLFAALLYRATPGDLIALLRPTTQAPLIR
jgi:energy-coupling factor transport system substrate-specific component